MLVILPAPLPAPKDRDGVFYDHNRRSKRLRPGYGRVAGAQTNGGSPKAGRRETELRQWTTNLTWTDQLNEAVVNEAALERPSKGG
jgi:hypothetical protein